MQMDREISSIGYDIQLNKLEMGKVKERHLFLDRGFLLTSKLLNQESKH